MIGAGVFGGFHAGKLSGRPDARLIGVYDPDPQRAADLAARHPGVRPYDSVRSLLAACDAIVIASPASAHGDQARAALTAGRHVLVEKPLATDARTAAELVGLAEQKGVQLHAGHQERFVARAAGLFDAPPPRAIVARRGGAPGQRGMDVSVVMDLMIHDLDLALRLVGEAPSEIRAGGTADYVEARMRFPGGAEAFFAASRQEDGPDRKVRLLWEEGMAELDWVAKTLSNTSAHALNPDFAAHPDARDSLGANVAAFIASIRLGEPPVAPGRQAAAAVALAHTIEIEAGLR